MVIDEITADGGAIEFVLGSHRRGDLQLVEPDDPSLRRFDRRQHARRWADLETRAVLAHPGDVLLWTAMTVHGSGPNRRPAARMTYMNGFCRADAARHWPTYLRGGEPVPIDPECNPVTPGA